MWLKTELNKVKEDITNGYTKLLYVAPESLTKSDYIDFFKEAKISFFAINEEWKLHFYWFEN